MGNVIGIVAEYNPFHNGHARLIEQTRARLGADCPVVCVMSGDFVQRGSPAVYAKFARAEAAARCGADLVLELPLPCVNIHFTIFIPRNNSFTANNYFFCVRDMHRDILNHLSSMGNIFPDFTITTSNCLNKFTIIIM